MTAENAGAQMVAVTVVKITARVLQYVQTSGFVWVVRQLQMHAFFEAQSCALVLHRFLKYDEFACAPLVKN